MSHFPYSNEESDKLDSFVEQYRKQMYKPNDLEYNLGVIGTWTGLILVIALLGWLFSIIF